MTAKFCIETAKKKEEEKIIQNLHLFMQLLKVLQNVLMDFRKNFLSKLCET
jgi:hypothetical protein